MWELTESGIYMAPCLGEPMLARLGLHHLFVGFIGLILIRCWSIPDLSNLEVKSLRLDGILRHWKSYFWNWVFSVSGYHVFEGLERVFVCSRSRAHCLLPQILSEIIIVLKVWIIEKVDCSSFFFAERLSLCQPWWWHLSMASKWMVSFFHHDLVVLIQVPSMIRRIKPSWYLNLRSTRTQAHHIGQLFINLESKCLLACIGWSCRALTKPIVSHMPVILLRECK